MLTQRQTECLKAIEDLTVAGVSPTIRQLAAHLGMKSTSQVARHLNCLTDRGYIRRLIRQSRAIEVIKASDGETMESLRARIMELERGKVYGGF